jgi:hypothetical protein
MKNHILSSLLLLLLALLLPFAFPLELKVQVVGWQQLKSEYGHLLMLEPGKRFEASLFKNRKGADGPKDGDGKGRQPLGHYDIGTFQLPEEWVNEMEVDQQNGNYLRKNVYTLDIFIPSGKNYLKKVCHQPQMRELGYNLKFKKIYKNYSTSLSFCPSPTQGGGAAIIKPN